MIDLSHRYEPVLESRDRDRAMRRQQELMKERSVLLNRLIWAEGLTGDELDQLKRRFDEAEVEYQMLQAQFETIH